MHGGGVEQVVGGFFRVAGGARQDMRVVAHADDVQAGLVVLVLRRLAQTLDDLQARLAQLFHPYQRQVGAHAGLDDGRADRLGDVVHRADLEAPRLVGHIGQRGDEDHRDGAGGLLGLESLADFEAGHAGHHHIQQDQVRTLAVGQFQRLLAILGEQQAVVVLQDVAQHLEVGSFVVHQQQAGPMILGGQGHACSRRASRVRTHSRAWSKSKSSMA